MKAAKYYLFVCCTFLVAGCSKDPISKAADGTFTDSRDQHVYKYVKIGTQTWMAENLAYLPAVSPLSDGSYHDSHYYVCGYEGSTVASAKATANFGTYGVLYNWPAALTACPSGWHLPTDEEWKILEKNQGMSQVDADLVNYIRTSGAVGGKLKEAGTTHWYSPNTGATNSTGFAALPGGFCTSGSFSTLGYSAYFWSASEDGSYAWGRYLNYYIDGVYRNNNYRSLGYSVRCLQNP